MKKLDTPISLERYAVLPNQFYNIDGRTSAILIGWGSSNVPNSSDDILQEVNLVVFSNEECSFRHNRSIHRSNICGGVPEGWKGQCSVNIQF